MPSRSMGDLAYAEQGCKREAAPIHGPTRGPRSTCPEAPIQRRAGLNPEQNGGEAAVATQRCSDGGGEIKVTSMTAVTCLRISIALSSRPRFCRAAALLAVLQSQSWTIDYRP